MNQRVAQPHEVQASALPASASRSATNAWIPSRSTDDTPVQSSATSPRVARHERAELVQKPGHGPAIDITRESKAIRSHRGGLS